MKLPTLNFKFAAKRLPGPGTGNLAFLPFQTLPVHSVGGPGVEYGRPFRAINEPPVYVERAVPIDGINGITTGDIQLYGLTDMDAVNFDFLLSGQNETPGNFNP